MKLPNRIGWRRGEPAAALVTREWMVANGLGGYASGTLGGVSTRRFHGVLVAALPAPLGRTMMLNDLAESLILPDGSARTLRGTETIQGGLVLPDLDLHDEVRHEGGLPVWRYARGGMVLEKRLVIPHARNTVYVTYRLVRGEAPVRLELRPASFVRPHEGLLAPAGTVAYRVEPFDGGWTLHADGAFPPLTVRVIGGAARASVGAAVTPELLFRDEQARGYDHRGVLHEHGRIELTLAPGAEASLVASVERGDRAPDDDATAAFRHEYERRERLVSIAHPAAREGLGAELVLAADQFIIRPSVRDAEERRARAEGEKARTVIAGYPWFTDWGRDTMISLEGLALLTGRDVEAAQILRTFAHHVKDGLIPNMFPEGESEGLYHTADATMWFFHALDRYVVHSGDRTLLRDLLPTMLAIIEAHVKGTRFGIHVDPKDGLLTQGAEGYQLTWMDAKVDGWVVTPRRGKAVEINALYYNALRVLARWLREERGESAASPIDAHADRAQASFNQRFWYERGGHLYDIVDGEQGDDAALRPNQLLAIGLPNPVLSARHWPSVVTVVRDALLTPVGLRSLSREHVDYKPSYDGDLRVRDAAYHQGTVWGWLMGPFLDAWQRVYPADGEASQRLVAGFAPHLGEACLGSLSEIFDAEAPYTPRGCFAQAWSVAEALRCFVAAAH
jgi:predicted glycogen debranching enzyme